ncbi:MAG: phosphoribosylaminoimidazolesuccinocarboxamide synthase [Candidatus Ancillula sp.]|jgi:phosphoribosylaminoimidazole-succinocarboxamide synthase|nr:phosphoribosylaminoimidazolesuccinocarboxamide synthase [Candidatus Ancillula sp.]
MTDLFNIEGWKHNQSGKVRELFFPEEKIGSKLKRKFGCEVVLMVSSDRVSAFDHILSPEIPNKGKILTQMSEFWFSQLKNIVPNHFLSADVNDFCLNDEDRAKLDGRAMVCKKLQMIPVECVARGFLTGSAYKEYQETGGYQEYSFPKGLEDGTKLDSPIFTPAMKAEVGEHDENVTFTEMSNRLEKEGFAANIAGRLRCLTLEIFEKASEIAKTKGLTLVDTKFEFGLDPLTGEIILGDEVLTPDSSRYWNQDKQSFDKQFVRNWLKNDSGWSTSSDQEPPALPSDIVEKTSKLYQNLEDKFI